MNEKGSPLRIVYFEQDVKLWTKALPPVAAVRPGQCPCCAEPGAAPGKRIGLVGHGTRKRVVWGPWSPEAGAEVLSLRLRRYRCRSCGAIIVSAPRGVLRGMLYGAVAVAMALVLWSAQGVAGWRVHARVSPSASSDDDVRFHGWRSLKRWATRAQGWWSWLRPAASDARRQGLAVVTQLAARATAATGSLLSLACDGALRS